MILKLDKILKFCQLLDQEITPPSWYLHVLPVLPNQLEQNQKNFLNFIFLTQMKRNDYIFLILLSLHQSLIFVNHV